MDSPERMEDGHDTMNLCVSIDVVVEAARECECGEAF